MKTFCTILCSIFVSVAFAQKGNELLVYSLKGTVTVVENNAEQPVKVGKVLKPGVTIKTQRAAKITMVCKEGKPISVTKAGVFPVDRWKDSCQTHSNSVTAKYFQFIWDQLYVRSDEYKKDHQGEAMLTDAPVRGNEEFEVILNPYIDTFKLYKQPANLTWTITKDFDGDFYFSLYDSKLKKAIYRDTTFYPAVIHTSKFQKYLRPGKTYYYTVSTFQTKETEASFIKYSGETEFKKILNQIRKMNFAGEDSAAIYFRYGYILEDEKFFAEALSYYKKASEFAKSSGSESYQFYQQKLREFDEKYFSLDMKFMPIVR